MRIREFKKMLKETGAKKMIALHCNWKIYLTNKQVEKCIELKNKTYKNVKSVVIDNEITKA